MSEYSASLHFSKAAEALRLEGVTTCVGFDDMLDVSLGENHAHFDHMIVVTSHDDRMTQLCGRKHGATVVPTDLFQKGGRSFNKGAAINAGMNYWQYHGWRMHLDSDIVLPSQYRRMLFNHTHLEEHCLYGADRVDVVGAGFANWVISNHLQHTQGFNVHVPASAPLSQRWVHNLDGYVPLGYFQLWHASCQKPYPYSLGTAAHDDLMFSQLWPERSRRLLPSVIVYHLCAAPPKVGENWDGKRGQPRLK